MPMSLWSMPPAVAVAFLLPACAGSPEAPQAPEASEATEESLLQSATPAPGATVSGPLNQLQLRFSRPVQLGEVTITGSDGTTMPMMITAAGANRDYSVPVPGLGPGTYTVEWKASAAGTQHRGNYRFTVR